MDLTEASFADKEWTSILDRVAQAADHLGKGSSTIPYHIRSVRLKAAKRKRFHVLVDLTAEGYPEMTLDLADWPGDSIESLVGGREGPVESFAFLVYANTTEWWDTTAPSERAAWAPGRTGPSRG